MIIITCLYIYIYIYGKLSNYQARTPVRKTQKIIPQKKCGLGTNVLDIEMKIIFNITFIYFKLL